MNEQPKTTSEQPLTPAEILHILKNNEVETINPLANGKNSPDLIELQGGISGIFKRKKKEVHLDSRVEKGTYFRRETAAYEVSKLLGYGHVPETTIRKVDGDIGSVQRVVDNVNMLGFMSKSETKDIPIGQYVEMFVFDYIIFNRDRHRGNVLVKDGQLIPIDHGASFGNSSMVFKLKPHFDGDFDPVDEEVSPEMKNALSELVENDDKMEELFMTLKKYLKFGEAIACVKRIEFVYRELKSNDWMITTNMVLSRKFNPESDETSLEQNDPQFDLYSTSDKELLEAI